MGGGGGETKVETFRSNLYQQDNSVHVFCHLLSLHCQRGGKNMGGVGHFRPIILCWCVGLLGMYTLLLVCTGVGLMESISWVCMLMGGQIVVYAGNVHSRWG